MSKSKRMYLDEGLTRQERKVKLCSAVVVVQIKLNLPEVDFNVVFAHISILGLLPFEGSHLLIGSLERGEYLLNSEINVKDLTGAFGNQIE